VRRRAAATASGESDACSGRTGSVTELGLLVYRTRRTRCPKGQWGRGVRTLSVADPRYRDRHHRMHLSNKVHTASPAAPRTPSSSWAASASAFRESH